MLAIGILKNYLPKYLGVLRDDVFFWGGGGVSKRRCDDLLAKTMVGRPRLPRILLLLPQISTSCSKMHRFLYTTPFGSF